ncbi:MAG: DUF4236 domain-containing protein [Deltaproteobacteria bacterium]|nr:DUF4236 domain-containing protein [Candidatus Anaeroferrophillacea bacterium]
MGFRFRRRILRPASGIVLDLSGSGGSLAFAPPGAMYTIDRHPRARAECEQVHAEDPGNDKAAAIPGRETGREA